MSNNIYEIIIDDFDSLFDLLCQKIYKPDKEKKQ